MKFNTLTSHKIIFFTIFTLLILLQPVSALITVNDVTDLQNMNLNLAEDYKLGNNIDASGTSSWNGGAGFIPIGTSASRFTGTFDGNNYTISDLTVNRPGTSFVGLFGYADIGTSISNVGLIDADIDGLGYVASLAGHSDGSISNSYSTGSVTIHGSSSYGHCGGLVGSMYGGTSLSDSYSTATISTTSGAHDIGGLIGLSKNVYDSYATGSVTCTGGYFIGGLVGSTRGSIEDSYATGAVSGGTQDIGGLLGKSLAGLGNVERCNASGDVTGTGVRIGGLVGFNARSIEESFSTGDVEGGTQVGGFAGQNSPWPHVKDCYSRGNVTGTSEIGGFTGVYSGSNTLTNSYSTGLVTGSSNVGGFIGDNNANPVGSGNYFDYETAGTTTTSGDGSSTGITMGTTLEMTYPHDVTMYVSWDFDNIWAESTLGGNDGYPVLDWEPAYVPPATPTPTPTSTPIYAPPPVFTATPTPAPTPIIEEEEEAITIIEEIIEKPVQVLDSIIRLIMGITFDFLLFIMMAYVGALLVQLIMNKEELINVLLYGTIGWILPLIINVFISLNLANELLGAITFFIFGISMALIGNIIKEDNNT